MTPHLLTSRGFQGSGASLARHFPFLLSVLALFCIERTGQAAVNAAPARPWRAGRSELGVSLYEMLNGAGQPRVRGAGGCDPRSGVGRLCWHGDLDNHLSFLRLVVWARLIGCKPSLRTPSVEQSDSAKFPPARHKNRTVGYDADS